MPDVRCLDSGRSSLAGLPRLRAWAICCVALGAIWSSATTHADEFTPLFNGKDLSDWSGDPRLWKVENGEIVGSTDGIKLEKNTFLSYAKPYGDFVLRAKIKLRNHNSGIQFRSEQMPDFVVAGYQADVAEQTYFGMLYEERKRGIMEYWKQMTPEAQALTQTYVKPGDWNEYEITCQGDHVKLVLNGHVTCDIQDPDGAKSGIIAIQLHAGPEMQVNVKDIEIKELPKTAQADLLMPDVDSTRTEKLAVGGARYRLPDGFTVEEVATNELIGSVINFTFDHLGRPLVATESEGVNILIDENGDGIYDSQKSFSDKVKRAMGLYYLGPGDLLVQSDGPDGPAIYRATDTDGDDAANTFDLIVKAESGGMGEHSPHAIVGNLDGFYYIMYGNHSFTDKKKLDPDSPSRGLQEDFLLPRYWDARGHAKGILAPGGTIQRLDPKLNRIEQISAGFRNSYDLASDLYGELYAWDSDMEWDIGMPWHRPVRVVHSVPGGDYGWRSGSGKMPEYYLDTLPPLDDVGRGSPVGMCVYDHHVYPARYQGGIFLGDWSRGRVRAIFPKPAGATYAGDTMDFVVGEPLNVTDVDVGPDGLLYYTVGGRGTHGGLWRVRYTGPAWYQEPTGIRAVLEQPMPRSAWGRLAWQKAKDAMGNDWNKELVAAAQSAELPAELRIRALEALQVLGPQPERAMLAKLSRDGDPKVRAAAVFLLGVFPLQKVDKPLIASLADADPLVARRACEALVRAGLTEDTKAHGDAVDRLFALLNHEDRYVRYAARLTLERTDREAWAERVLADDVNARPVGALEGLLALIHTQKTLAEADAVFAKLQTFADATMTPEVSLDYLRVVSLAFIRDIEGADRAAFKAALGPRLLAQFPNPDWRVNRELQVVLAGMKTPGTIPALLASMTPDKTQQEQIHTAYALRTISEGWTPEERTQFMQWFDRAREMSGGASFEGFIEFIWQDMLAFFPEEEKKLAEAHKAEQLKLRQEQALALLNKIEGERQEVNTELAQMSFEEITEFLEYDPSSYPKDMVKTLTEGEKVFMRSRCVNCHVFGTKGKGGGPDLSTVASRFRRKDLLEAIMYPSRVVSDQYVGLTVDLDDLSSVTGMLAGEDDQNLTLITMEGIRADIPKKSIVEKKVAEGSVMPEGLQNTMTLTDLINLINFLEHGADTQ